jgi:putative MATE family efflux protein
VAHPLLTAPIGKSLWSLAAPTTAVMVAQTFVAIAETFIFGRLGTEALAGFALVFPFMMMMTMMAAGGMGGGVAAAMARAVGGGRIEDARALVIHALVLGAVLGLLFTLLAWTVLPSLYGLLGGEGRSLANALTYSHVLFSGALLIWANFFLSSLLRGGGDAATPGRYMLFSSIAQVPLSYVLALGIGDWPGLGMAGPAISSLLTSLVSAVLQARALWRGKLGFVPAAAGVRLQGRLFWDILRVGLIASFSAFTANLTAMLVTGLVGRFGVAALAGYGIGVRLEFMLVPLAFGIGSGLTTLVGVAAGADDWKRAVRAAWIGSLTAAGALGVCGWILAFVPEGWARLFTDDPKVVEATVAYITRVAPFYCLFGLGMTLSFASQGAGRMKAPFAAGIARLLIATVGGWFAVEILGWGLPGVFVAIAVGMIAFGGLIAGPLLLMPWGPRRSGNGRAKLSPTPGESDAAPLDRNLEPQSR